MAVKRGSAWKLHLDDLPKISRRTVFGAGFAALSVLVVILVAKMVAPFLDSLLWAAVLSILAYPVNKFLRRKLGNRPTLAAAFTTALMALVMLGIMAFLGRSLLMESRQAYQSIKESIADEESEPLAVRLARIPAEILPGTFDDDTTDSIQTWLEETSGSAISSLNRNVTSWINRAIGNASKFLLDLFVAIVSLFFLLKQGEDWFGQVRESLPLSPRIRTLMVERFTRTFRAIVYGVLVGAAIEAVLMTAGFAFFGIPLPIFFGVITFFILLVPFIGPPLVWIPATLYLWLVEKDTMQAIGFGLYGGLVVFVLGSLIKPAIIGTQARLPIFFVFLSILGGIIAFGAVGIVLGPILLAIAISMARIYREIAVTRRA